MLALTGRETAKPPKLRMKEGAKARGKGQAQQANRGGRLANRSASTAHWRQISEAFNAFGNPSGVKTTRGASP